uniref:Uncharacterized protein n=1 Tax=Amphimedon queenslandica TaxID=400682 RepID=A0A1X7TFB6_AMPQE
MTSFQRMVLVAAIAFMITAHAANAKTCLCYPQRKCEGNYEEEVEGLKDISISSVHHKEIKKDTTTIKLKMTSFQRMVLVAAALFMITAHVIDARTYYCYPHEDCEGNAEIIVS